MNHQAKRRSRQLLVLCLGGSLAGCGVASEVATNHAHPLPAGERARLAEAEGHPRAPRLASDTLAAPPPPPAAAPRVAAVPPAASAALAKAAPLPAPGREPAASAMRTQSGRIIDEAGQPLVGATVLLKGTTRGASTDASGGYSLQVPLGLNTFVFGYGGYQDEVAQSRDGQPLTVTLLPTAARVAARQEEPAPPPRKHRQ